MNYLESITYLDRLTDYEKSYLERCAPEAFDPSRIRQLLAALVDPQSRFPALHIAGTKGKGSTAALAESCLRAAGYRTGLYTSPHLHTFRERIQVAGRKIERKEVVALVEEVRPVLERTPDVTYFEAVTAIGFLHFARSAVDVAVVEVGLGGRLDATNVLIPEVSIITSLSLEHTYILGHTLAEIAYEKAGIIKPGVPVVTAPQRAEAMQVLEEVSREREAPLTEIGRHWEYEPGAADLDGQAFSIRRVTEGGSALEGAYWIPLLGRHQLENAANAIAALDLMRRRGFDIPPDAVREGLRDAHWPGRMEVLSREPLVVADGAHNLYSVQALREALEAWFADRRWVLIFGVSGDKDAAAMMKAILPICSHAIVTSSDHPRSAAPVELADRIAAVEEGVQVGADMRESLRLALTLLGPDLGLLVTGSVHLAADAREEWARHAGATLPDSDLE